MVVTLRRLLRTERTKLVVLSAAMAAWFALMMLIVRNAAEDVTVKTQFAGSAFTRGFGLTDLISPDAIIAQLTGVSFNHPIVLALVGAVTIAPGARACQGELERGTLDMTLARPVSRAAYLLGYVAYVLIAVTVLMVVAWAAILGFDRLLAVPGELQVGRVSVMCLNAGLVFATFAGIALLISVLLGRRGNAVFVTIGVLVVMYALTFAERAWSAELLERLGPLSIFHWFDPGNTLMGVPVYTSDLVVPAAVFAAGVAGALWWFERRDL